MQTAGTVVDAVIFVVLFLVVVATVCGVVLDPGVLDLVVVFEFVRVMRGL